MERLSFLVSRGENDCLMAHGLDWASYSEAGDWNSLAECVRESVHRDFNAEDCPLYLDFRFMDGTMISLGA